MATFKTARRYYLHSRRHTDAAGLGQLASVWRGKQESEPGTALPAAFPALAALSDAYYTTSEDLDGCDAAELVEAGLSTRDAGLVIAELAELLG